MITKKKISLFLLFSDAFKLVKSDPFLLVPCVFSSLLFSIFFNLFFEKNITDGNIDFSSFPEIFFLVPIMLLLLLFFVLLLLSMVYLKKKDPEKSYTFSNYTTLIFGVFGKTINYFISFYAFFIISFILLSTFFDYISFSFGVQLLFLFLFFVLSICNYFLPCFLFLTKYPFVSGVVKFSLFIKNNSRYIFYWFSLYFTIFILRVYILTLLDNINSSITTTIAGVISGMLESFLFVFTFILVIELLEYKFKKPEPVVIR